MVDDADVSSSWRYRQLVLETVSVIFFAWPERNTIDTHLASRFKLGSSPPVLQLYTRGTNGCTRKPRG